MLTINKTIEDGKGVISLEGRLDTITSREFSTALNEILSSLTELTLDFEKLEYISSAGLRVLVSTMKSLGKDNLKIINVNQMIMDVFEVTGFSSILNIQ